MGDEKFPQWADLDEQPEEPQGEEDETTHLDEEEMQKLPQELLKGRQDSLRLLVYTALGVMCIIVLAIVFKPLYTLIGLVCGALVFACLALLAFRFIPGIGPYLGTLFLLAVPLTFVFGIRVFKGTADPQFVRFVNYSPLILVALLAFPLGAAVAGAHGFFTGIGAGLSWWYLTSTLPYMQMKNDWSVLPVIVSTVLLLVHVCGTAGLIGMTLGDPKKVMELKWPGTLLQAYLALVTVTGAFIVLSFAAGMATGIVDTIAGTNIRGAVETLMAVFFALVGLLMLLGFGNLDSALRVVDLSWMSPDQRKQYEEMRRAERLRVGRNMRTLECLGYPVEDAWIY